MIAFAMFIPVATLTVATFAALRRAKDLDPILGELTTKRWPERG